jgi:hypothetical protein
MLGMAIASAAVAQQFRDPATGQIWTPETVGRGAVDLSNPVNRAFDPRAQAARPTTTAQTPNVQVLGSVPITAGPTVPIAIIGSAALSVIPGQRWQVVLQLDNNSAGMINPVVACRFNNSSSLVEEAQANLPPVAAGQRVGFTIYGPAANLYVNQADCRLVAPV